jgi:agmatine/peptidylarginine deiminase
MATIRDSSGRRTPAEWEPQSAVQLTWPHEQTDWAPILNEITEVYMQMAHAIAEREQLIIVSPMPLPTFSDQHIIIITAPTNDTWARDHGFITVEEEGRKKLLDFKFNGWGEKFAADLDNGINRHLYIANILQGDYESHLDFVLEGGSIESDGKGTIFTTTHCLMAPHRNQPLTQQQIEHKLKLLLGAKRIVWIDYGHLTGDDTDGHIDTLVRIAPNDTLLYVGCDDPQDEQFAGLKAMELQLQALRTTDDKPYRLILLPMPDAIYDEDGERLPATYANYLVINGAVLYPTYNQKSNDDAAAIAIQEAFPDRELIGIDCRAVIRQHGSLHCCTMQYY